VTGKYEEFDELVENYTLLGEGSLWVKQDGVDKMNRDIDDQIVRLESRAKAFETRLNKQFLRMESTMVKLKAQSSYLMSLSAMTQAGTGGR
jgi:flagellar hook-associated protein 2